jgi:hypothetical protein
MENRAHRGESGKTFQEIRHPHLNDRNADRLNDGEMALNRPTGKT